MPTQLDLRGQRFGRLTALRFSHIANTKRYWHCRCDCGAEMATPVARLLSDHTRSCGCLHKVPFTLRHGHARRSTRSSAYHRWLGMKWRCLNPRSSGWKNYGGRGITVCDRWLDSFENFLADMGEPPMSMMLERKDNDHGYSPENCVWATRTEQNKNRRKPTRWKGHRGRG